MAALTIGLRATAARAGYGLGFAVVLPALLVRWASSAEVGLPAVHLPLAGVLTAAAGAALMVSGWSALWFRGGGLPMNAFPPPRLVSTGVYALLAHPIYAGFCLACAGVSIAYGSAAGLWLVTPVVGLSCAALVLGYEARALERRFGPHLPRPLLALPPPSGDPARLRDRLAVALLVAVPWLALYGAVILLGPPRDALATHLPVEARWPVLEEAELLYCFTYPFAFLCVLAVRTRAQARALVVRGLLALGLVFPLYFFLPLSAPPRPFAPSGALGRMLLLERDLDTPAGAFPSFHVIWALLAAEVWGDRFPRARPALRGLAWAIAASCVLTGMHSLLDVIAGALSFAFVMRAHAIWDALRRLAERLANTWLEWHVGPARILGYGFWAAAGNLVALPVVAAMLGPGHVTLLLATAFAGMLGALLWAQAVERPDPRMRPFGFYGGLFGIILAAAAAPLFGAPAALAWKALAGYCCAAPFVQSLGRVRCLVQGCCHGTPASPRVGIRYRLPQSRVAKAGLGGVPVHPTPLYSILWNAAVALVLLRLWSLHAATTLVCGVYLILSGIGRFVEEAYRGEPQTPVVAGLRLYQWVAAGTLAAGAVLTCLPALPAPSPALERPALWASLAFALLTWFAYGVDFPRRSFRLARLC